MRQFFKHFGRMPYSWPILLLTVLSGFMEGFGLTMFIPLLGILMEKESSSSKIYDVLEQIFGVVGIEFSLGTVLIATVVLIVSALALILVQRRLIGLGRHGFAAGMRRELSRDLLDARWAHIVNQTRGETINDLSQEVNRASAALQMQIMVVAAVLQMAVLLSFSLVLSWEMLIVASAFAGIVVLTAKPWLTRAKAIGARNTLYNRRMAHLLHDYFQGVRLIKATNSEGEVENRLDEVIEHLFEAQRDQEYNTAFVSFLLQGLPVLMLAVIIAVGTGVLNTEISVLLVFLLFLARAAPRIAEVPMRYENYSGYVSGLEAIDQVRTLAKRAREDKRIGGASLASMSRGIAFENVSFHYDESDAAALHDITVNIAATGITAIVGVSGAGKSTLMDLLVGFYQPSAGRITVDGINLADMDLAAWRSQISYVTQDVVTFDDTIRNNLLLTHADAEDEEILSALHAAGLETFVRDLRDGLDTYVGDNGVRLSGGQRQRLYLARALLRRPRVLLLDEATSALDPETEKIVQAVIEDLARETCVIVIAHRLTTVRRADVIHVLEKGRVFETGTYDELRGKKGRFSQLHGLKIE